MTSARTIRSLAITASVATLASVGAAPATADVRPGVGGVPSLRVAQDLRSPDTRDAASGYSPSNAAEPVVRDLRSPDTRDAAAGYDPQPVPEPATFAISDDGFDWVSAAIGGAVLGGLVLLIVAFRPTRFIHRGALHT